ncbi:major facilitator superfamily, partial [Heterobasidion irregulare TC 32-1]
RNIGNARIAGLQRDLKMTNHQFSTALTVTYVPYILMEIPMNLLMKRIGANITLPTMVILWGIVCACQGAVKTYGGLIACRFFLGAMEGGIFPGIVLYLSSFYKRHVLQTRFSLMFSVTSLAGAFSGLLAAAIQNMDGIKGLAGWAWIFILEGACTTAFGLISMFFIPATPADMPWLTSDEKTIYLRELAEDWSGDDETDIFSWSEVWSVFVDGPHILLLCLPMFLNGVMLFGLANFIPTIVNALGFSPTHSQLLAAPPYACSFVLSVMCSYFADRYRQRGPMCICVNLIAAAGYAIFLGTSNKHANYAALFLQIVGVYSTAPCIGTWSSNNVQPHYRRATAIGLNFICTNIGGTRFPLCAITFPQLSTTDVQTPRYSLYMDLHSPPAVSRCVRHQLNRLARHGVFLRNPDGLPQVAQRSEARTGRAVDEREWGRSGTWRMEFT